jgi:hypothetical protein
MRNDESMSMNGSQWPTGGWYVGLGNGRASNCCKAGPSGTAGAGAGQVVSSVVLSQHPST